MFAVLDLARENAALLVVIMPLTAAAICFALGGARASWAIAGLGAIAAAALASDMAARVLLMGAAPPSTFAGFSADGAGVFVMAIIAVAGSAISVASAGAQTRPVDSIACALVLAASAAWMTALFARDWVILFVGAEAGWLASVGLMSISGERDRAALNGALRMLAAGGASAAFMLLGAGMIAATLGSLELSALLETKAGSAQIVSIGVALIAVSLALKAGVAPLHVWVGAAFGRAGDSAALVLGAIGVVGALGVMVRVSEYAVSTPAVGDGVTLVLAVLGLAGVVIGSVQAVGAQNLSRLAGYALGAQAGCVLITLALGSPAAIAAALLQILAACASALALLGGAAAAGSARTLPSMDGLARRAPLAAAAVAAGALGLMGAPLTLGFLGRWRLIETAVGIGWWWAAAAAIGASLAGVFYGGRLIERIYFRRVATAADARTDVWRFALTPLLAIAVLINALGLDPGFLLDAAAHAALLVDGAAP